MRIKNCFRLSVMALSAMLLFTACMGNNSISTQSSSVSSQKLMEKKEQGILRLAFNSADGINPYLSNTNLIMLVSGLVFSRMVELTPNMKVELKALSEVRNEGLTVTLTPNALYTFADNTRITAQDILESLLAAKNSVAFSGSFSNIEKAEEVNGSVVVTLFSPDSFFEYLLTIPVIKASETAQRFPMSSGRYVYSQGSLLKNEGFTAEAHQTPSTIELVELSDFNEIVSALGVNAISLYHTELENTAASSTTSQQTLYKLNNLVYLGINATKGDNSFLSAANARVAVSTMLDRQIITDKCYYLRAYPALGAINSFYPSVATKQAISPTALPTLASSLVEELGYKIDSVSGYYHTGNTRLELRLLVYSGSTYKRYAANIIKETLSQNGIFVSIDETDNFDIYTQKISSGEFDMYIGEVKLYNNMDLTVFMEGGAASHGLYFNELLLEKYEAMRQNAELAPQFEAEFSQQMPYIPLLWRCGTLVTSKKVHGIVPSLSDIFYDINSLNCAQ